jgi:hypothetical protein
MDYAYGADGIVKIRTDEDFRREREKAAKDEADELAEKATKRGRASRAAKARLDAEETADKLNRLIDECRPMSIDDFMDGDDERTWLVDDVLVGGATAFIIGPRKSLKTTLAVDLAVSVASGTPFLGKFPTNRDRVLLVSGESAEYELRDSFRRVAQHRGVDLESLGKQLHISTTLPDITDPAKLAAFEEAAGQSMVLIIDPLYKCLGAGGAVMNLAAMGDLLRRLDEIAAGRSMVICHHTLKDIRPGRPLELNEVSFAGVQEHARQWMLLNALREHRLDDRCVYDTIHCQWGGSARHGGTMVLDVTSNLTTKDGRNPPHLEYLIRTDAEYREARQRERADQQEANLMDRRRRKTERRQARREQTVVRNADALLQLIPTGGAITVSEARRQAAFSGATMATAVEHLESAGKVKVVTKAGKQMLSRSSPAASDKPGSRVRKKNSRRGGGRRDKGQRTSTPL